MLTVFLRVAILYFVSVIAMRLMGKRQVGQLQPYEFVLAIMIADLAASPMENVGTPLLYGIIPIVTLLMLHGIMTLLNVKWIGFRRMLCGGPSVIIRRGAIQYSEMKRMNYSLSDLLEEMRGQGYLNIAEVETAILETCGKLSVFPRAQCAPLTLQDMKLQGDEKGIPMTLIMDGKLQEGHLQKCGLSEAWLREKLNALKLTSLRQVLLASLDTDGNLYVQQKKDQEHFCLIPVMNKKDARW